MRAGELRHRVKLQRMQEVRDSFGEARRTWYDMSEVWAAVEPLGGRELLQARQVDATLTTRIVLRWRGDVDELTRVVWVDTGGVEHVYNVVSVAADKTHRRQLTLLCREVR